MSQKCVSLKFILYLRKRNAVHFDRLSLDVTNDEEVGV